MDTQVLFLADLSSHASLVMGDDEFFRLVSGARAVWTSLIPTSLGVQPRLGEVLAVRRSGIKRRNTCLGSMYKIARSSQQTSLSSLVNWPRARSKCKCLLLPIIASDPLQSRRATTTTPTTTRNHTPTRWPARSIRPPRHPRTFPLSMICPSKGMSWFSDIWC